ncbi:MAG: helix-turn-helix domain-containing protein [Parafilimonas terrae]|nr:helix-turn-helix domain-containing protein [Parafilimonas terrae]
MAKARKPTEAPAAITRRTPKVAEMAPTVVPLAISYRVENAAKLLGLGKTTVWDLIWRKELVAHKIRGATVILHDDLVAFVRSSPRFEPQHPPDA